MKEEEQGCGPLCLGWRMPVRALFRLAALSKGTSEQIPKSLWREDSLAPGLGLQLVICAEPQPTGFGNRNHEFPSFHKMKQLSSLQPGNPVFSTQPSSATGL